MSWRFLPVLFLAGLLISSGCMVLGSGTRPAAAPDTPRGLTDITGRSDLRVTLDTALLQLGAGESRGIFTDRTMTVHQVMGVGLDDQGRARGWVLGVREGGNPSFLEYSPGGWRTVDLASPLPEAGVAVRDVVRPESLYARHRDAIGDAMRKLGTAESDLDITGDTATVTVHSAGGSAVLTFNAETGELLSSV